MKNKFSNLNDHLFAQLERLSDEDLKPEQVELEAKRAAAMVDVADQIIRNAAVQIRVAELAHEMGAEDASKYLPTAARQIEGKLS